MKNRLLLLLLISCSLPGFGKGISCKLPPNSNPQHVFSILREKFLETAKQDLGFHEIHCDPATQTISTETRTFKLRRKTPRIGEFPELHRPKWKKEKIRLTAEIRGETITVELTASAYNRRDRQWHKIPSTLRYEEEVLENVLTKSLEGLKGFTMGSPLATGKSGTLKLKNLTPYTVTNAYISLNDMKSLVIDLTGNNGETVTIRTPFLGSVNNICFALHSFFSKFSTRDLRKGVPRDYDFYWAYAQSGELMDGMQQNQVLAALGKPDRRLRVDKNTEKWVYERGNSRRTLTIVNGELSIPDPQGQ